jgi:DsbC/DsbD-like thiol-disulfide interchange protein
MLAALTVLSAVAARAEDASPWHRDLHSAARLVAGTARPDGALRAGVEIRLDPDWKTYWRYPGDSGIPPRFDFSGSTNVAAAHVAWPIPKRFQDGGGMSIGYVDGVIFPVRVVAQDPTKPVRLRMRIDYAACHALCVPASGAGEIALPAVKTGLDGALAAAEARVPKSAKVGETAPLAIHRVRREDATPHARVIVDVAAPAGATVDMFAEGPAPDWALPLPSPVADAPAGLRRFVFALDGLPPGARAEGAVLTLTVVSERDAIEVATRLD